MAERADGPKGGWGSESLILSPPLSLSFFVSCSACPSVISLTIYLHLFLSISLSLFFFIYLIYLASYLSIYLFVYLFVYLSAISLPSFYIYISICLSVYLSIYRSSPLIITRETTFVCHLFVSNPPASTSPYQMACVHTYACLIRWHDTGCTRAQHSCKLFSNSFLYNVCWKECQTLWSWVLDGRDAQGASALRSGERSFHLSTYLPIYISTYLPIYLPM